MKKVRKNNACLINRFFTRSHIEAFVHGVDVSKYSKMMLDIGVNCNVKDRAYCISEIYAYLRREYQNEYFYKNTLLNKLLMGIHNVRTTTALTEIPVGTSKADFILINGKAVVYEIKTFLDNFQKLGKQVEDYYKAFSYVTVVTDRNNLNKLNSNVVRKSVGICILSKRGNLQLVRSPIEYKGLLSKDVMFGILRKKEFENIIGSYYGMLPNVSDFCYYSQCLSMFKKIPIDIAYEFFLKQLKKRGDKEQKFYETVPYELKAMIYFSRCRKEDCHSILELLSR